MEHERSAKSRGWSPVALAAAAVAVAVIVVIAMMRGSPHGAADAGIANDTGIAIDAAVVIEPKVDADFDPPAIDASVDPAIVDAAITPVDAGRRTPVDAAPRPPLDSARAVDARVADVKTDAAIAHATGTGTVTFNNPPKGSSVKFVTIVLDGKNIGTTPILGREVPAGHHTVEYVGVDRTEKAEFDVEPGKHVKLTPPTQ